MWAKNKTLKPCDLKSQQNLLRHAVLVQHKDRFKKYCIFECFNQ